MLLTNLLFEKSFNKQSEKKGFTIWRILILSRCLRIPWISFHTAKNQSVKVLDKFKEQTNRRYSSITFLKSSAYTWALTSSRLRELDNLEGQSASQWVTGIDFETKQDWRPQPHSFLEKRSFLFWRPHSTQVSLSKFLDGLCHLKDDFCSVLTSCVPALSFVTFLSFGVKSSNTVTASYNYMKYFQVINQPVTYIQFIVKMREKTSRRPPIVSRVFID